MSVKYLFKKFRAFIVKYIKVVNIGHILYSKILGTDFLDI
jgi:hypothetical protein